MKNIFTAIFSVIFTSALIVSACSCTQTTMASANGNESSILSSKQESSKRESSKQESSKQDSSKQESSKQESSKQESSKQESSKQESSKQESSKQESSKQESSTIKIPNIHQEFFKKSAFLGNSLTMGLSAYKIITKADFYCKVGLTAYGVIHETLPKQKQTVLEQLIQNKSKYQKVYLMFGTNETGLYDKSEFIEEYQKIVESIKTKMPNVKIYIQSILPITAKKDKANVYNLNNKQIEIYNKQLIDLAKKEKVKYLNIASVFKDSNGCLPESYSPDGVHLNADYYYFWTNYLEKNAK